jgi:hypothetical protein
VDYAARVSSDTVAVSLGRALQVKEALLAMHDRVQLDTLYRHTH